ncbi:hypothetical protein GCM10017559_57140 [Streptosporangium longisporum]|uniref:Secreted protein n=1 Tax=Streptosporangium longisporum TaxID=46187 RepID=A0ABP6KZL9_9ACTN
MFLLLAVLATAFIVGFTWVIQVKRCTIRAVPFLDDSVALSARPAVDGPTIAEAARTVTTVPRRTRWLLFTCFLVLGPRAGAGEGIDALARLTIPAPVARTGNARAVSPACFRHETPRRSL